MTSVSAGADEVTVPFKTQLPKSAGLSRSRLEEMLIGPDAPATVFVVAPPGAGKTTLLSMVAAAAGSAAWFTAGAEDGQEATLVRYLSRALLGERARYPPAEDGVDGLLAALGAGVDPEPLVSGGDPEPLTSGTRLLVIDDAHEIAGTPAEAALERFLRLRPASVRVLLGLRRPPSFNTARMLASGDVLELTGDDLRFRSWEVEGLFRNVYREPLTPETAALLCRRVGGLAAALQLFHLSVRGQTHLEREAEVVRLSGRSRLIRSYLARTVLGGLSAERRQFLLRTAPLGVLDGTLCDTLLDRSGSAQLLRELAAEHLFTTTPDEGLTYRYHQVLRDHLEVVLEEECSAAEVTVLYAGAARLLERAGHHAQALRAYKRAGDWGAAARLVRERAGVVDPDPEVSAAGGAPTGLTPREQDDPWLAVARIRRLLRQGSIEAAILALRLVERAADDPDLAAYCVQERHRAAAWRGNPAPALDIIHTPLGAVRALTRTVDMPHLPDHAAPEWGLVRVISHLLAGRVVEARAELDRSYPMMVEGTWPRLAAGMLGALLDLETPGQRGRSCAVLEDMSLTADVEGYPWLARVAQGLQACLVLDSGGEAWRIDACRSAISACERDGDTWGELVVRCLTGVALARQAEYAEAHLHLARAATLATDLGAPVLGLWVHALTAAVPTLEGDPPASVAVPAGSPRQGGLADVATVLDMCRFVVRRGRDRAAAEVRRELPDGPSVHCLGGFRLHAGGDVDVLPLRPRARLLLMLLAMHHGADVHRERLIEHLWPGAQLSVGTRRLQVAVSSIRGLLEGHGLSSTVLQRHGDAYRLELPGATLDLHQVDSAVSALRGATRERDPEAVGEVAAALLGLYRGDLLPEVGEADWVVDERDRLRLSVAGALADAAAVCLEHDRADLGVWQARRAVQLDPWRDSAWLLLARLQQRLGDHSAAQVTLAEHDRVSQLLTSVDAEPVGVESVSPPPPPGAARVQA